MRLGAVVLAIVVGLAAAACDRGIGLKFENKTDSALCWYESEEETRPDLCAPLPPHETHNYSTLCGGDADKTVVLRVGGDGEIIYSRTATCDQWSDSGAWVTIETVDRQFAVNDSLPE
jgi:hypothetical protein